MVCLGIAQGLFVTLRALFRKPFTVQYPEEKLPIARRLRGNEFFWDIERCTGCATCAKLCPQGNIEIVTHPEGGRYVVDKYEIDTGRCIFCGCCVESCPFDALHFGRSFEKAEYTRKSLVKSRDDLRHEVDLSTFVRPRFEQMSDEERAPIPYGTPQELGAGKEVA
ncbi:MAG: NADH-quinone oxidoreductase subunit I [Chloroflexi bacterium]|nr:NADH-quinone oxidoreductase subunit I [Chloroflexota bacterium]